MKKNFFCMVMTVCIFLMGMGSALYASDEMSITFASEEWQYATQSDGTGLYWDIFRAVFEPEGYKVKIQVKTYDASVRMVEQKKVDAMVGAYEDEFEEGIFPKMHFAVDVVQAMYKNKKIENWQGVQSISGKSVSWIKGYSYDDYLDQDLVKTLKIKRLLDRKATFRLVDSGKIDVVLDAESDLTDFFKTHPEYDEKQYERKTFLELKLFTVFSKTDRGKELAAIFDRRFKELVESGEIKKLYGMYSSHSTFKYPSNF